MRTKLLISLALGAATLLGQRVTDRRTATIRGGGGEGKCTIEVVVDDTAHVEIRGNGASIRTMSGAPATFRRFECNQDMPNRPYEFRFKGIDGRGRQELVNSPDNGGQAVIRIQDSKGGSEGYTFDIFWNGGDDGGGRGRRGGGGFGSNRGGGFEGNGGGFGGNGGNNSGFGGNGGWNNGWGNGSGWNSRNFDYSGGRRGSGSFRDQSGQRRRLDSTRVFIGESGNVRVSFNGENGNIEFEGRVESRNNRRVFATVNGGGRTGQMIIEMSSSDQVSRIVVESWNLTWSN